MLEQLVAVRCIADHEVFVLVDAIHQNIVAAAALVVADEGVPNHARLHAVNLARADMVEELARVAAAEAQASHV